jgi:hypothetical protein
MIPVVAAPDDVEVMVLYASGLTMFFWWVGAEVLF